MIGHNPPDITPYRSESPVQWQGRIKTTESHIADLKAKFQDRTSTPDTTPWFRTPWQGVLNQGVVSGGFTSGPPICPPTGLLLYSVSLYVFRDIYTAVRYIIALECRL